jgi:hypothetical protein
VSAHAGGARAQLAAQLGAALSDGELAAAMAEMDADGSGEVQAHR